MSRSVLALYEDVADARKAVAALVESGVPREEISLILRDEEQLVASYYNEVATPLDDTIEGLATGAFMGGLAGLLAGLFALVLPGLGPVVAAGPLAAGLAGTGVGALAGGLLGALIDLGVDRPEAEYYIEGIRRGGVLVAATADDATVDDVVSILDRYDPIDLKDRVPGWKDDEIEEL